MNHFFIGIDLGTSGIKAGVIDTNGKVLADLYWDTRTELLGPGRMKQNPDDFFGSTIDIVRNVIEKSGVNPDEIVGLTIDGQMGGIIGIDSNWEPLTGLDMGLDIASEEYNVTLHQAVGASLRKVTCGSPRNTPKIMYWMHEYPEIYTSVEKFVTLSGYVAGCITGLTADKAFIDYTLLSFFGNEDAQTLKWSEEITKIAGIDINKLPNIVNPWDIIGYMTETSASQCGLKAGLPVFAGAGDQPAGFLGAGFIKPGMLMDVSGSSTLLCCNTNKFIPDSDEAVMYMPSVVKNCYTAFNYINGGGISLKWFRDELASGDSWADLSSQCRSVTPGCGGLLFIPYLGGRQCPINSDLRGGWLGLNWGHSKGHMYRAVLEGIAYDYALGFKNIQRLFPGTDYDELLGTGGGSRDNVWNQIKADVLGIPYRRMAEGHYSLRGCALIAGYGLGIYDNLEEASLKMQEEQETGVYKPNPENKKLYEHYLNIFRKAVQAAESYKLQ